MSQPGSPFHATATTAPAAAVVPDVVPESNYHNNSSSSGITSSANGTNGGSSSSHVGVLTLPTGVDNIVEEDSRFPVCLGESGGSPLHQSASSYDEENNNYGGSNNNIPNSQWAASCNSHASTNSSVQDSSGISSTAPDCLYLLTTTWSRDSHELFDYESRHVHQKSYFLKKAARAFRMSQDVRIIPDGNPVPSQSADYLLCIRQREGRYIVGPAEKNFNPPGVNPEVAILPKKLWLIVKELPDRNHNLQENDVIKLGRFKLRVKQLVRAGPSVPELHLDDAETPHSTVTSEEAKSKQCRICLLDGGTCDDPLLCPCQCKGSIKFVHLDCLRQWINGRLALSDEPQRMSFFFKQLHCELCKTPFPSAIVLNSERVPIVTVPKVEAPFLILENITANRGLHVISMGTKKELKLGRGHESDVRIADVSISRYHATIRFYDGEFILEDHNSKFGTLVSLRRVQPVEPTHALAVQVGRTVLKLSLRKPPCDFVDCLPATDDALVVTPDTE